ncbi:MAG: penicillin-binding protein 2 [Chloroflexi bacterium]|nr:penicillin-binding protein 2 [Chloroflexota bacterium]
MARQRRNVSWRVGLVVAAIVVATVVLLARLVQLQILEHSRYAAEARLTHVAQETVVSRRGAILDRSGYPLAASVETYDVMVEKRAWESAQEALEAATAIAAIAGGEPEEMVAAVSATEIFEIPVARSLNYEQAAEVRKLALAGVRLLQSSRRVYPEGNLAAQLIGFVGRDNTGLSGLEADLEDTLGGSKGELIVERDGLGNELFLGTRTEVAPRPGADVVLTIDRYIQALAERELDAAIETNKARGGTIIVMNPKTGAILAMTSRPSFNLRKPDLSDESKLALLRNRAITDQYEPGSVFKLVTAAGALDAGLVSPDTWWYDSGVAEVDGWTIRNWDFSANGSQTVTQILSKSLNTGAVWLSQMLGPDRFYDYVHRFGFGEITNIGLTGEAPGQIRSPDSDPDWREVNLATNSFGQGISVTPLQMVSAVAAIANNGKLMRPYVVQEVVGGKGRKVTKPQVVRQAISPEAARTLRQMMGVVVEGIPSAFLDVQGYVVGGKTGTANIATGNGTYKDNSYIASFVGIAPLDDPVVAILVKIDEPRTVPWGTIVAAPAFDRIVEALLPYYKIPPDEEALVAQP